MSVISEQIRKSFKEGDDIRDEGLKTPENIERFDDIIYGTDPDWQVLDVYRPIGDKEKKLPVIVSVHGGGWVYGDKKRYQYYTMGLAQRGFAVVNFTYRLAPEFKFPAPLEDTNLVMQWVMDHAKEYGFIFQSSEIYDGLSAVYDYGQLGAELKNNLVKCIVEYIKSIIFAEYKGRQLL